MPPAQESRVSESTADTVRISKAVELLLAAKLLLRGHHVSVPLHDEGIDLIVDYQLRVQIKSSANRNGWGRLHVSLDGRRSSERGKDPNSKKGRLRPNVDVLAVYARDTERWWFIPRHAIDRSNLANITGFQLMETPPSRKTKGAPLSGYLEAWYVFNDEAAPPE